MSTQDHFAELEPKPMGALGHIARIVTYVCLFTLLWILKPDDNLLSVPLATLTLGAILGSIAWVLILLALGRALFKPSEEDFARSGWRGLGKALVVVAVGGGIYLWLKNTPGA